MGLKKGVTNNPNGRPKGKQNKITIDLKKSIKSIIENEFITLPKTLKSLDAEKRIDIILKLLPYVMPKLQNLQVDTINMDEQKKKIAALFPTQQELDELNEEKENNNYRFNQ